MGDHWPAVRRWLPDLVLAAVASYAAVALTAEIIAGRSAAFTVAAEVLAAAHGGAIVLRRSAPVGVLAIQAVTAVCYVAVGLPVFMLGPAVLVTMYTIGARLDRQRSLALLAAAEIGLAVLMWVGPSGGIGPWAQFAALVGAAWFLGDVVRRWQVAAAAHEARAAELQQARGELARLAVVDERLRIARELHDVVAHSMSVVAMHAGSGRLAGERDPVAARRALEVVERSSRDALAEMRRLVGVLRDTEKAGNAGGGTPVLPPAPSLADVHRLVAEVAAAGVPVEVHAEGDLAGAPEGVSLAAYRIVQEALTNVVRHAGPARVRLSVVVGDDEVDVQIEDDGQAAEAVATDVGGHGTIGMRERAQLYGGRFASGPGPGGGWRVAARLPFPVEPL